MKLFECADGSLINPFQVCSVESSIGELGNFVVFNFSGSAKWAHVDCENDVKNEMIRFKKHFETEMKS